MNKLAICTSTSSIYVHKQNMKAEQDTYIRVIVPQCRNMCEEAILANPNTYVAEDFVNYMKKYIAADNFDLSITPYFLSGDRQRKSLHWFLEVELDKRVLADNLSRTGPQCDIKTISCLRWLPTVDEIATYHHNINFHILKTLLRFDFLQQYAHTVPECIEHPFMSYTAKKTEYRIVQLYDENENSSDGMIDYNDEFT